MANPQKNFWDNVIPMSREPSPPLLPSHLPLYVHEIPPSVAPQPLPAQDQLPSFFYLIVSSNPVLCYCPHGKYYYYWYPSIFKKNA